MTSGAPTPDYSTVTESAGVLVTRAAVERLLGRYAVAAQYARGARVLEVACGAGVALQYLARHARLMVGGDYTDSLLRRARVVTSGTVPLVRLDAQHLPFRDGSFDLVVLNEAIYYLPDADAFIAQARRVLNARGVLVMCSVNPEWTDFHPSPFSNRYYSHQELIDLLSTQFQHVRVAGAYRATNTGVARRLVSALRWTASATRLMPATMKGKERLKRLFYGPLTPFPDRIDVAAPVVPPPLESPATRQHVVLCAVATAS